MYFTQYVFRATTWSDTQEYHTPDVTLVNPETAGPEIASLVLSLGLADGGQHFLADLQAGESITVTAVWQIIDTTTDKSVYSDAFNYELTRSEDDGDLDLLALSGEVLGERVTTIAHKVGRLIVGDLTPVN